MKPKALILIIEINFFYVFFGVESKYEIRFFLTISVFALEGGTNIISYPVYRLFTAMSSLLNVRNIDFHNAHLATIPSRAFNFTNGLQNNLETINFSGNNIKSIGEYAFYYHNNLTVLKFEDTPINHHLEKIYQTLYLLLSYVYKIKFFKFLINSLHEI